MINDEMKGDKKALTDMAPLISTALLIRYVFLDAIVNNHRFLFVSILIV